MPVSYYLSVLTGRREAAYGSGGTSTGASTATLAANCHFPEQ